MYYNKHCSTRVILSLISTILLCVLIESIIVEGQCPHQQVGLVNFNTLTGWNVANYDIVITKAVKLNISPPNKLRSITVKSGGSLIFDNIDLNLNLNFIRVESNGSFIMGSSNCPITSKVILTLYGDRVNSSINDIGSDPFDGSKLGSKGVAFLSGSIVQIYGKVDGPSWSEIIKNSTKGSSQLELKEAVQWRVGDSIVIASTDYGELYDYRVEKNASLGWIRGERFPNQNEERKIIQLLNGNKTIILDRALNYTHFASVDGKIRAEVGLLTRRIVFRGDDSSESSLFGGHFIIRLVDKFNMEGVEITRFGQQGLMGRYSFHFHLLQNKPFGLNFTVKDNTVHHSFQRCYVVHDTNYILLKNNVCYRAFGHMYFLEDGSEVGNEFNNNLGVDPIPISRENPRQIILSDSDVSVFWITNPNNTFIGNHAVGGRFPFWFTMPTFPTGLSANRYAAGSINPRTAPPKPFENNVGHSSSGNALHIDDMEKADGSTELAGYYPSGVVEALYNGFIAYKNRGYGVWARGGLLRFKNLFLTDNRIAMNSPPGPSIIHDSTFIGESENVGEFSYRPKIDLGNRTRPGQYISSNLDLIKGYETYDNGGPQYLRNITFINFVTDSFKYAGSLSSLNNYFKHQSRNRYANLKFVNANRYMVFPWNHPTYYENHKATALMDVDGSITSISSIGGWITGNDTTMTFTQCQARTEWNAYQCPFFGESFAQFRVLNWNLTSVNTTGSDGISRPDIINSGKRVPRMILVDLLRNRQSNVIGALSSSGDFYMQSNLVARGFYGLRWPYDIPTPKDLSFFLDASAANDWIVVAVQYPKGTIFNIRFFMNPTTINMTRTANFTTMLSEPKNYYYYDDATEHLYLKIQNQASRTSYRVVDSFVDYYSYGVVYLNATCPRGICAPSKFSNPSNAGTTYKTLMREDRFVGRLETCQQASVKSLAANSTSGGGYVFAFLNSKTASLDFTVQHNLNAIVTSIDIGFGLAGKEDYIATPTSKIIPYTQSRFGYALSYDEWNYLLQGKMFVKLSTTQNPNGHLRAQLYINNATSTSCNLPPLVSNVKPCDALNLKNSSHVISIYSEGPKLTNEWSMYAYVPADIRNTFVNASYAPAICGNSSMHFGFRKGNISFNKIGSNKIYVDTSIYQYFEFFIKTVNNTGSVPSLTIVFGYLNVTKVVDFSKITTQANHTQYLKIDGNTVTRVRIPLSELGFAPIQNIHRIILYLPDQTNFIEFLMDNMRFVGAPATAETRVRTMTVSQCKYFGGVSSCGSLVNPDPDPLGIRKL
ncbi:hypothetical protein NAEGRDRAFT_46431 [Naegleria gruberi]|uniref:G8 domain-containing protein n=1 Tax=Naegleria gruberi TaxID=5762 RepID=D2V3N6_NAEGR|nr:uncharacterized protein NAEGRDRAFT_46431 [Naegleria gruberi]EFC48803.1 hypothetical protein NAEGRDRAFT_46431 [Naegleria gruberi]|eukprot:XP_002681547.1 hypothetical protein NAEGRDRAFT_46431 [Naegleria gruberi strain NEG-M]